MSSTPDAVRHAAELRQAVRAALHASPDADLSGVDVHVEGIQVTLVGTIPTATMRPIAVAIARDVAGEAGITDLITVADEHTAITQTMAADEPSHHTGSDRGASPQEAGLVPSSADPLGPWNAPDPQDRPGD